MLTSLGGNRKRSSFFHVFLLQLLQLCSVWTVCHWDCVDVEMRLKWHSKACCSANCKSSVLTKRTAAWQLYLCSSCYSGFWVEFIHLHVWREKNFPLTLNTFCLLRDSYITKLHFHSVNHATICPQPLHHLTCSDFVSFYICCLLSWQKIWTSQSPDM